MIKKICTNIMLIVCIIAFLYSGYYVVMWLKSDRETKKLEDGLYTEVVSINNSNENENEEWKIDFDKLQQINSDVVGWIQIDNTHINYPILQGPTNEYYLKKDIYKQYNFSGSIFIDCDASRQFLDENMIIYGHNMRNQRMFADIEKIYDGTLGLDIDVKIFTKDLASTYKVFSCYKDIPHAEIIKNQFNDEEKEQYINTALTKSRINFEKDIILSRKIITLVTCGTTSEERIIVHAIEDI